MKRVLLAILAISLFSDCFSQYFPFDSIPGSLKNGACAVVRSEQCLYTISKPGVATMKFKKAITLLNEASSPLRYVSVPYDKFSKVKYLRGMVYDEKGKTIKAFGTLDVLDLNAIPGGTFYSEDRKKVLEFPVYKYPFTIEYEYEITFAGQITYPDWEFQDFRNVSVEKSGIQFIVPESMKLRYYEQHLKNVVDSMKIKSSNVYTWMETNLSAKPLLKSHSMKEYVIPTLFVAPLDFEMGRMKGSMRSWQSLGQWQYELNKDRDKIPAEEEKTIKDMASKFSNERDLIKAIYEYMQSRTRYLSVQIGIGGNQTAEASDVSKYGFGDCKGLVNYSQALLKVAGIKSYYTLVKAGPDEPDIYTNFVDDYFNHIILCVPQKSDTIWLECTNQNLPFNYLGSFTSNRHVLMITPEGGKLVKTPGFKKEQNMISNTGNVFINVAGTSTAIITTSISGYYFGNMMGEYSLQSEEGIKRSLYTTLDYPDFSITSAKYTERKSGNPVGTLEFQAKINELGTRQGEKLYFIPSVSRESFFSYDTDVVKIPVSSITTDSITFFLPVGYKVETVPEELLLQNEYGKYSYKVMTLEDRIIFRRRFELNEGRIKPEKYIEFRKFYNSVARKDRSIVMLSKAGQP